MAIELSFEDAFGALVDERGDGPSPLKLLLWSREDSASAGIAAQLVEAGFFAEPSPDPHLQLDTQHAAALARLEGPLLTADFADRRFAPPEGGEWSQALFLSKHSAASGLKAFTVHPVGNLGPKAELGGAPRSLAPPAPEAQTSLLQALTKGGAPLGIGATFESTHHGPQMRIASAFVEVGSTPREWQDPSLCGAVARAVIEGYLRQELAPRHPTALALGGGHYHPRHGDLARREGQRFGHMVPAYALADLAPETLRAAAEMSGARSVVVDRRIEPDAVDQATAQLEALGLGVRVLGA